MEELLIPKEMAKFLKGKIPNSILTEKNE